MYKSQVNAQLSFDDFNQPIGLMMNSENRWIKKADQIPWAALEKNYAKNFRNRKGDIVKPLRMALGALLIQIFYSWSDEEVSGAVYPRKSLFTVFHWSTRLPIRKAL